MTVPKEPPPVFSARIYFVEGFWAAEWFVGGRMAGAFDSNRGKARVWSAVMMARYYWLVSNVGLTLDQAGHVEAIHAE